MSKKTGCQNKIETVERIVLAKSQALEGENHTRQQLVSAKGVRVNQIATLLGMSAIRVHQIIDAGDLPHVLVETGERGRPPMEVTGAVADLIISQLDPDGTRTAPKKAKPAHRTTRRTTPVAAQDAAPAVTPAPAAETSTELVVAAQA